MNKPNTGRTGALIVWVLSYIFFLFRLSDNLSASHDSIHYLNHIVQGEHLFHQHHLLYHFSANGWLNVLRPLFPGVAPHYIVESFTALWGSAILSVCYLILRNRFFLLPSLAAAGILPVAFSYGLWFYSINVEVYTPSIFFILCSLYVLTRNSKRPADIWLISVLHCFAILFHQVNILFSIVVLYAIYRNGRGTDLARYVLTGIVLVGGMYFIIGWVIAGQNSLPEFGRWIMGYTIGHDYWQPVGAATPFKVAAGFSRAFIGGHFIFQLPATQHYLQNAFAAHSLKDEIFLSRHITPALAWVLSIVSAVLAALIVGLIYRFIRRFNMMNAHFQVIRPLLLCLVVYFLFFVCWMPEIPDFWILQMVIVWLLLFGMLSVIHFPFRIRPGVGLLVIAAALFFVNYLGSIRWIGDHSNDWYYQEMKKLPAVSSRDLIIVREEWILKDYMRYFTPAEVLSDDEPGFSRDAVNRRIDHIKKANGKAYLYDPQVREWKIIQSY